MRMANRLLLPGLFTCTLVAYSQAPVSGHVRGWKADFSGPGQVPGLFTAVTVWEEQPPGAPRSLQLSYYLTLCAPYQCGGVRTGSGPIPDSAVQNNKDGLTLDVDTELLPPPFQREGAGGRIRIVWKKDGADLEEHLTGTRRIEEGGVLVRHESGPVVRWYSMVNDAVVLDYSFPYRFGWIEYSNQHTFVLEWQPITLATIQRPELLRERGLTFRARGQSRFGNVGYSGDAYVWVNREPGKPDVATMSYTVVRCVYPETGLPSCMYMGGYGEIPMSAVTLGKDSLSVEIDTSTLPPSFSRWGDNGGMVKGEWRPDGVRVETLTGSRTVITPSYRAHTSGTTRLLSATVEGLTVGGAALSPTSALITEENRTAKRDDE